MAASRLRRLSDGSVLYRLRHAYHDGTKALVFPPLAFIERLCALIPPPRPYVLFSNVSAFRPIRPIETGPLAALIGPVRRPDPRPAFGLDLTPGDRSVLSVISSCLLAARTASKRLESLFGCCWTLEFVSLYSIAW